MASWITPGSVVPVNTTTINTIGEVNYGATSQMFVFAYEGANSSGVISDRTVPAYNKLRDLTPAEITQVVAKGTTNINDYIFIKGREEVELGTTEIKMLYDQNGIEKDSGLRLASNGQVVGTLQIEDMSKFVVFVAMMVDPPMYKYNVTYRPYSHVVYNDNVYKLRPEAPNPFTTTTSIPDVKLWDKISPHYPFFSDYPEWTPGIKMEPGSFTKGPAGAGLDLRVHRLSARAGHERKCFESVPNPAYWKIKKKAGGSVDEVYTSGNTLPWNPNDYLTTEEVPRGEYRTYNGSVYQVVSTNNTTMIGGKLTDTYLPPASPVPTEPDLLFWVRIGPSYRNSYTPNTIYKVGDTVNTLASTGSHRVMYTLITSLPYIVPTNYDSDFFTDVGAVPAVQATSSRMFSIVINSTSGPSIDFVTKPVLKPVQVGELLGDIVNNDIVAVGPDAFITYEIPSSEILKPSQYGNLPAVDPLGYIPCLPPGILMANDGRLYGRPKVAGKYAFNVKVTGTSGTVRRQRFSIVINPGYYPDTFSASFSLSQGVERDWYDMIANVAFTKAKKFRESDPNYGLRTKPEILIKDNILGKSTVITGIDDFEKSVIYLRHKLNHEAQAPIMCRIGNIRFRTAVDSDGTPMYDLLYKELIPLGNRTVFDNRGLFDTGERLVDLYKLKNILVGHLGSDDERVLPERVLENIYPIPGFMPYKDVCQLWQSQVEQVGDFIRDENLLILPIAYLMPGEAKTVILDMILSNTLMSAFYNKVVPLDTLFLRKHSDFYDEVHTITLTKK